MDLSPILLAVNRQKKVDIKKDLFLTFFCNCIHSIALISFFIAAFHRDCRGPVRFSHLLHEKDDPSILRGVVEAGGCFEVASFLQESISLCHQCIFVVT